MAQRRPQTQYHDFRTLLGVKVRGIIEALKHFKPKIGQNGSHFYMVNIFVEMATKVPQGTQNDPKSLP